MIEPLTAALVLITGHYAYETSQMRKSVQKQAEIADQSLRELREQVRVQQQVGRMIVANAIQSASAQIEFWTDHRIAGLANSRRLPKTINLVPDQAGSALEHASRISTEAAANLRSAFDALAFAQINLEILRDAENTTGDFYDRYRAAAVEQLNTARTEIDAAVGSLRLE